jgi:hypothetical protein
MKSGFNLNNIMFKKIIAHLSRYPMSIIRNSQQFVVPKELFFKEKVYHLFHRHLGPKPYIKLIQKFYKWFFFILCCFTLILWTF